MTRQQQVHPVLLAVGAVAVGAGLAVVTAGGSNTTAIQDLAEVEYAATQLSDTVYLVEPRPGLAGNLAVSVGDDGILLVDSDMMPLTDRIKATIAGLKPGAIDFMVNTHYHYDHAGGNAGFGSDSLIMAHESIRRRFPGLSEKRVTLMAMLKHLDDGVGSVVAKLRKEHLFNNTLVFFLTDNGGSRAMTANNAPLRGFKGSLFEGGIRTPMIVSWPGRFGGGRSISTPVISLDILPTVLDAVGDRSVQSKPFDGKSLLPLLTDRVTTHHDTLYFSEGSRGEWAVRRGDWKLYAMNQQIQLFNLDDDPAEKVNVSAKFPGQVKELKSAFDRWIAQMADPITGGSKRAQRKTARKKGPKGS